MSVQKASEIGWMYHTSARADDGNGESAPPASQIPGLSDLPAEPPFQPPVRGAIKDIDSAYVRLAKQGGREDLLRFKDNKPPSGKGKSYPRVDWFYLEDNRLEDEEQKARDTQRPHEFLLPEYMVHDGNAEATPENGHRGKGTGTGSAHRARRIAYQFDECSPFESNPTDKTVKLPELRPSGYGIRLEKAKNKPVKHVLTMPERGKAPVAQYTPDRKVTQIKMAEDQTCMAKVLRNGYLDDWKDARDKWDTELHDKGAGPAGNGLGAANAKIMTEYQATMVKSGSGQNPRQHHRRRSDVNNPDRTENKSKEEETSEPFIMSRFKNVPARTDSNRRPVGILNPDDRPIAVHATAN